jgi:catechol 2,3-dioxygenase-like lactoylglutathione lyase family enzyme
MVSNIILTIPTTRLDESVAFYTRVLQFAVSKRYDRPGGVVLVFLDHSSGFTVEFVAGPAIPAGEVGAGAPVLTFMAGDFLDITSRLTAANLPVPKAIDLSNGISMLRFHDPNGVVISFVSGQL